MENNENQEAGSVAQAEVESPVAIQTAEQAESVSDLPTETVKPVNHTQTEEFYELPSVSNEVAKPAEAAPAVAPVVALEPVNVEEHKTGMPDNTTGGQLDLAIDRFHELQDKDVPKAKLDLLARLRVLELEAESFVKEKIDAIRAAL